MVAGTKGARSTTRGDRMNSHRIEPGPGQESAWDYPRPPAAIEVKRQVLVKFAGEVVGQTNRPIKVMETSHPPVYYVPPEDVAKE
jgi:uncharacterized protein (DUF427 family)